MFVDILVYLVTISSVSRSCVRATGVPNEENADIATSRFNGLVFVYRFSDLL